MRGTVDVAIPAGAEAAPRLEDPHCREAVGRYVSGLLKRGALRQALAAAIAEAKREARAEGLAGQEIDAEIEA